MMMTVPAKCPHCGKQVLTIEVADVPLTVSLQPQWKGFAYLCPLCRTILSVGMNPLAGQDDVVRRVTDALKRLLRH